MADNRNQNDQQRSDLSQQDPRSGQDSQRNGDNVSNDRSENRDEDQNPQEGSAWSNYQTRELGGQQGGGEGNASTPRDSE